MTALPFPSRGGSFVRDPDSGALQDQKKAAAAALTSTDAAADDASTATPDPKRKGGK